MGLNTLETASIFQQNLDKQMVQEAVTGWMELNASQVRYNGGAEVKIPKMIMDGLATYDRSRGYVDGGVTLSFQTKELTMDRGRRFYLDAMDVDETGFVVQASLVMGEFQRTQVVPEVDAYRISAIATLAGAGRTRSYTAAAASVFGALVDDINTVRDKAGDQAELVCMISIPVHAILAKSSEYAKQVDIASFKQGELETRVRAVDGVPLLRCPSSRMKSAYVYHDGETAGQEDGGFVADDDAKDINWIVMARRAPIAVSKTDVPRIFDPSTVQKMNAWQIDYRKFHDLWILDNQLDSVFVDVKGS